MIDDLIAWLPVYILYVLGCVALGWWIQERITEARWRRLVVELYTRPPMSATMLTVTELRMPTWMEDGSDG